MSLPGAARLAGLAARMLLRRDDDGDDDGENTNCIKAVPGPNGHVPYNACNSYYNYDPKFEPAVAVCALFGICTLVHFVLAIVYRKVCTSPYEPNTITIAPSHQTYPFQCTDSSPRGSCWTRD